MNNNNLYYKRGVFFINKFLKIFTNDSTFYKKRLEFIRNEINRMNIDTSLVIKDFNTFTITALTALLGINKENIEKINRHNDYKDLYFPKENIDLDFYKNFFPDFINNKKIETQYDEWLSVENCDYPTSNFMMNVRNAFLHSEYEYSDDYGFLLEIKNSNYTNFKSKVLLAGITNFFVFYFGNNSWNGLSERFMIFEIDINCTKMENEKDLRECLSKKLIINEVIYSLNKKVTNESSAEKNIYKIVEAREENYKGNIKVLLNKSLGPNNYDIKNVNLTENDIEIIIKMLNNYYGDGFYKMSLSSQNRQLCNVIKYYMNSRSLISEWICDYLLLLDIIRDTYISLKKDTSDMIDYIANYKVENDNRSVFVTRTSLLFIKLYHVLYRIQNKKYESIDYNKIIFDSKSGDYTYSREDVDGTIDYDFSKDILKLKLKYPGKSDNELEKNVICEIIRNSLSHGNIEMNFKVIDDKLVESVVFEDSYHSKIRKLEITLEKLEKFLESPAFTNEECILKDNEHIKTK